MAPMVKLSKVVILGIYPAAVHTSSCVPQLRQVCLSEVFHDLILGYIAEK